MARLSGIQQDVLSLYRRVLREAVKKDRREHGVGATVNQTTPFISLLGKNKSADASTLSSSTTTTFASAEFRRQAATAKRSDFKKVEYMIRKGDKQIKLLRMPGVKVVRGTPHN
jgi:hypothetical protein